MAISSDRQSLIPSFLYSTSFTSKALALDKMTANSDPTITRSTPSSAPNKCFMIQSPSEPSKIEMFSPQFYAACTVGGILSCGLTHMAVTPLDLVKCNMQVLLGILLVVAALLQLHLFPVSPLPRRSSLVRLHVLVAQATTMADGDGSVLLEPGSLTQRSNTELTKVHAAHTPSPTPHSRSNTTHSFSPVDSLPQPRRQAAHSHSHRRRPTAAALLACNTPRHEPPSQLQLSAKTPTPHQSAEINRDEHEALPEMMSTKLYKG